MQLTLREMRELFTAPKTLAAMLILGVMLGLVGPFSTFDYFEPVPRVIYWIGMVFFGYGGRRIWRWVGRQYDQPIMEVAERLDCHPLRGFRVRHSGFNSRCRGQYCGARGVGNQWILRRDDLHILRPHINLRVSATRVVAARRSTGRVKTGRDIGASANPKPWAIAYMSMQDHYVNVVTSRGQELLLMRLSDAMKEAEGVDGLKIHRSHWIAREGIKRVTKQSGNYIVEMLDGTKLPVSRGQVQTAKDAGIIS